MRCVYCKKEIFVKSSEHVIQNAIGGILESENICCPECNLAVEKFVDKDFVKIFSPITNNIDYLPKRSSTESSYDGQVMYAGRFYDAKFKGRKIISVPKLQQERKCGLAKIKGIVPKQFYFNLQNEVFKSGISKIAFNFAVHSGINPVFLKDFVNVEKNGFNVTSIKFKNLVVPFCPLNIVDSEIEFRDEIQLYHNLILFSNGKELWCYVDLFNVFQFYVLLSEKFESSEKVLRIYAQKCQKIPLSEKHYVEDLHYVKPKHISALLTIFGVTYEECKAQRKEGEDDFSLIRRIINEKIRKESVVSSLSDLVNIGGMVEFVDLLKNSSDTGKINLYHNFSFYFDENDNLIENNFRQYFIDGDGQVKFYPHEMIDVMQSNPEMIKEYGSMKFKLMCNYILKNSLLK
ncbi:HNH endonuclease [Fibrobacter sp. UWB16]|uniref:HNH endonuclease n=1 Tax=Fibrobacter sp. UWB16 TaxID=1945874 RepID=UPI000BC56695|nr:HNH endonuclease [Fibrobacter sp. UWB16]SOD17321.1 HNH endonuclease [Fibrobacter sp. UWB16]